ncbi:MAG: hypothetical protein Q9221_002684 [Calogaya cf. arnoldii]
MHSFNTLLVALPFLAQTATAYWYVDFYENACKRDAKPGTGTLTLIGDDGEPQEGGIDGCKGGPVHPSSSSNSRSVGVNGITDSGLIVEIYAAKGCPRESFLTTLGEDDCYTSSSADPINFIKVKKMEPPPPPPPPPEEEGEEGEEEKGEEEKKEEGKGGK